MLCHVLCLLGHRGAQLAEVDARRELRRVGERDGHVVRVGGEHAVEEAERAKLELEPRARVDLHGRGIAHHGVA